MQSAKFELCYHVSTELFVKMMLDFYKTCRALKFKLCYHVPTELLVKKIMLHCFETNSQSTVEKQKLLGGDRSSNSFYFLVSEILYTFCM